MSQILEASFSLSLLKRIFKRYSYIEKRLQDIYSNSLTHELINRFWKKIKICLKFSFFGRITETKQITPVVLDSSWTVRFLINLFKRWKNKIIQFFKASSTIDLAKDTKKDLSFSPVRVISTIGVIAIITDVFLSIILQKHRGLWGWLIRGLFSFVAVSGLFCTADWPTVKKNSVFFRKIR